MPETRLASANARLAQTYSATQSLGPLVGGALVRLLSAPVAVLVDAVSYAVSAVVLMTVRAEERAPERTAERHVWRELREGAAWVYRHAMLRPYAISLHLWFFANAMVTTVLVYFATTELHLDPLAVGLVLAATGVTGVLGAGLSPRLGLRFGTGRVITTTEWLSPAAYALLLLARARAVCRRVAARRQRALRPGDGAAGPARHELPQPRDARPAAGPDERDDPVAQLGLDRRGRTDRRTGSPRRGATESPSRSEWWGSRWRP